MAKKFKVMASNAKEPDGKCIPKSMRKSVESACGKKKAVKASDSERKYRIDIFKKDNPDALVKREFKMFKSEGEAKKYGESIANGNIVNVMKVNAGCTKKSIKAGRFLFPWEVEGEFADGYRHTAKGDSEAECIERLISMQDKHGELVWYSGTDDEYYDAGRRIDSSCTKKSVKASSENRKWVNVELSRDEYEKLRKFIKINGYEYSPSGVGNMVHVELYLNPTEIKKVDAFLNNMTDFDDDSIDLRIKGDPAAVADVKDAALGTGATVTDKGKGTIIVHTWIDHVDELREYAKDLGLTCESDTTIETGCTKKSVKSSKGLTDPKSKRKSVKASSSAKRRVGKKSIKASSPNGYSRDERFALAGEVLYRAGIANQEHGAAVAYYLPGNYVLTFNSANDEMQSPDLIFTIWNPNAKDEFDYAGILYTDLNAANRGTDATEALFNKGMGSLPEREEFSNTDDAFRKALDWVLMQARDYKSDRVWELQHGVESSKSVKKFGIKASKAAKKRKAIKASGITDDIVIYFNGDNVYQGSIYDMADAIENLCYDDEVNAKFQEWCNQFGDPFDFDGSPIDTARVFTDIIIHEAEEAPMSEDGKSEFYVDGNGILDFEILYANDGIYSAKSIKCWDNGNDVWEYQESYDNYYDEEPPEHIAKELERLAKLTDKYTNRWFKKFEELHPGERFSIVYPFPDVDEAVGYTLDDAEYRPDEINSSTDIKADTWESSEENIDDMLNDSYEYDGFEDSDMLEYVDSFLQDASSGAWLSTDHVVYNGPDEWEVSAGLSPEAVESDFWFFLDDVDHELYEEMLEAEIANPLDEDPINYTYNQNAINGNEFYIQLYPNNNQVSAPQIDFDEKYLTSEWLDRLEKIRKQYEESRKVAYTEFQNSLSEFLANGITASTDIKAANSLNLNAKPNYTDWMLRGYKFDGEDVTTLRIDFQDDVKQAVMDMFADPDIETVDLYKIPTEQETTGVFEDEEYFKTFTREDINSSVDIEAGITVGEDSRFDFSNPIYELDDYVKAIADGVVNQINDITYDISKETIAFFDADNNVVFVQPIGGIIPEPEDLETDIDELSAAIQSEMDNAYARDNWEQDEDDPDYASRAVELSEDIGEVDIDDLEPITGDGEDIDYGFGFDSNGDPIDESTVEELYRIAEYEILPNSELAKIDEYVSIDEDSWDFYLSSPTAIEKFYIHFKLTEKDINLNDYALPDDKMFPDFNYYTADLDFDIYVENGEITSVILEDKKIYRPDGAYDEYDVKRFDDLYNVAALINYVEHLAADTVKDIYNGTTNL